MKNKTSLRTFRCGEPYMDLLSDCCEGTIEAKNIEK